MVIIFKRNKVNTLTLLFFINAFIEIVAEYFSNTTLIFITKPLIPLILIVLYWISSSRKNILFVLIMIFSLITNILFVPKSPDVLFYGIIAFTFHRIILIYYVFQLSKIKNYIPFLLTTIPLLFIFFYLFFSSSEVPKNSYALIIFHNIMGAVLGGIGISNYIVNDNKRNSILMISVLLFLGLQLVIYVERYYLYNFSLEYIRPLAMLLNVLAFYAFYKYVINAESNYNRLAT
jgi:hypothetical protein